MAYTLFLVDDHPVVRRGYVSIIEQDQSFEVCGQAASGEEALEAIPNLKPDLVITDVLMDGMGGIELIKYLKSQAPGAAVLVASMHEETVYAERALEAGAMGYVMKGAVDGGILAAIRTVLRGAIYVSPQMNDQMLRRSVGRAAGDHSPLAPLSDRELEVFEHLGRGLTTREIAEAMLISPKTVSTHRRHVQEKLNISTIAQLRQRAVLWTHQGEPKSDAT